MTVDAKSVFINVPFDKVYEPLFITLVGTLVFLGQTPHCVLEVREQGDGRLARILDLMRNCRISIHDLSRVSTPVRFNMPFELGLACALKLLNPDQYEVVVLDSRFYRIDKYLSDYKGRDPLIHNSTPDGVLACLFDAFGSDASPAPDAIRRGLHVLRGVADYLKHDLKTDSIFRPSLFRSLGDAAKEIATDLGFIKP